MLKPVLNSVAKKQLMWNRRSGSDDDANDILSNLSNVRSVLLFLPENHEDFGLALNRLKETRKFFPRADFYGLVRANYASFVAGNRFKNLFVLSPQDLGLTGLPKRTFMNTISKFAYDLLIDFNNDFDIVSTYICSRVQAKVRVCLEHPGREPFYNLLIRAHSSESLDDKIDTMFKYLSILSNPGTARADLQPA